MDSQEFQFDLTLDQITNIKPFENRKQTDTQQQVLSEVMQSRIVRYPNIAVGEHVHGDSELNSFDTSLMPDKNRLNAQIILDLAPTMR